MAISTFASYYTFEAREDAGLADEYLPGCEGDNCVERLDLLGGQTQVLLLAAHLEGQQGTRRSHDQNFCFVEHQV
jgi:hypothetical protein